MKISDDLINDTIKKGIWTDACPVSLEKMVVVKVMYIGFDDIEHEGEIMVFDALAKSVKKIFAALFEIRFPIYRIDLINKFDGDDNRAMEENNTSGFNCRYIEGTTKYSMHSYGMAIDINPVQNPFVFEENGKTIVLPEASKDYLDRNNLRKGMVTEEVVKIFKDNEFAVWGGEWNSIKDWHHFEVSKELLAEMLSDGYC